MAQIISQFYPRTTTQFILRGTYIISLTISFMLVIYNGAQNSIWPDKNSWVLITVFSYLGLAEVLLHKQSLRIVNWMLIIFYLCLSFCTLLVWGINAPIGILTISFAVILPSILLGSGSILPVSIISIVLLLSVQFIHNTGLIVPNLAVLSHESTYLDIAAYATVLSVFALVSWLASAQREKSLKRANLAEAAMKKQKEELAVKLKEESAALRQAQISQMSQLYKFALIGQSTAATLHEIATYLSILNFDINDLQQQYSSSKAILNTKESILHINNMVRQARQHLDTFEHKENFNAIQVIEQSFNDLSAKFKSSSVKLVINNNINEIFNISGNKIALMQIISILLNNALDACKNSTKPCVEVGVNNQLGMLTLSIIDNGCGVPKHIVKKLFNPVASSKSTGLGVGLYIAQRLAEDQFSGHISLIPTKNGAHFSLTLPEITKPLSSTRIRPTSLHKNQQSRAQRLVASP